MVHGPNNHGLGRRHAPDLRDTNYPIRALPVEKTYAVDYRYWWDDGAWLNQGQTETCVGHAWAHWIEDSPITHPDTVTDPYLIYAGAQMNDEWPGIDYEGTSVRGGAKWLQDQGIVGQYHWGFSLDDVRYAVKNLGPVIMGTNWYDDMFNPVWDDAKSRTMVRVGGKIAGGHAYVLNGINEIVGTFRLKNSWGRGWGVQGRASISFEDVARLLSEDGEACIATEVKH
jgi:hypothetical protein